MKLMILLVAILAIATARVNSSFIAGNFSTKLGFTEQQQAGLQTCAHEIRNVVLPFLAGGRAVAEARLLSFVLADDDKHKEAIYMIIDKAEKEFPACRKLFVDVDWVFAKSTTSNDERNFNYSQLTKYRVQKYTTEIFSAVITILEAHARGNSQVVGESLATLVQLITRLPQPEILLDYLKKYDENQKDAVDISIPETDRLFQQTINSVAQEFGREEEVSEERAKELRVAFEVLVYTYVNTTTKERSIPTSVGKRLAASDSLRDVVKAGVVVLEKVRTIVNTIIEIPNSTHEPITKSQSKIASDVALKKFFVRLPTIQRRSDLCIDWRHHHGASAGKGLAGLVKGLFSLQ